MMSSDNNGPALLRQIGDLQQQVSDLKAALTESDDKFRRLTDSAPVGFYLNDAQGRAIYINRKCAELVGVPADKALNFDWIPLLHPDDRERMVSAWEGAVKNSSKFHLEYRWVHSDGKVVWTLGEVIPIIGDKGKASLFIGTLTDITERKQAEEALQESERTFRSLFEGSSDAILLLDDSGVFVECNQAALDLLKMPKEQFIHLQPFQISPEFQPDGRRSEEAAAEMISKAFDQGKNLFDWTCVNSEGDKFIIEVSLVPIKIKGQTMLHNTWRDITERKQAEERLREAELKLRRTIEHSTNLFYMHTADHVLTYVSPQSQEFFDCKPEDAMIRWPELLTDNPLNQEGFLTTQRAIDTGKRQPPYQVECIGKRGRKVWVEVNEAPLLENGRTVAISGTLTDITERKKAEEELAKHQNQLELLVEGRTRELKEAQSELVQRERLATLGRLTATVSHEIRNPLATIQTAIFSISESLKRNEPNQIDRAIQLAERNIIRCVDIIEDLTNYTRVKKLNLLKTSLADWLKTILEEHPITEEVCCELELSNGIYAHIDQEKLRQVMINLINNAVHALLDKSSKGKYLQISTHLLDGEYEICVLDDGVGMSDETRRMVFEPLYSTKGFGVGLGMVIAKSIVEQHHGEISIESKEGKGTTVKLRLPIKPLEEA